MQTARFQQQASQDHAPRPHDNHQATPRVNPTQEDSSCIHAQNANASAHPTSTSAKASHTHAPTILTLLRIAATTPGVTLSGYIIRAPRRDERVTVDAISAPEHLFAPDPAGNDDEALLPIEWNTFCRVLGISDEVIPPDEFGSYRNADREGMWRAWWD